MKIITEKKVRLKESTVNPLIDNILDLAELMGDVDKEMEEVVEDTLGIYYDVGEGGLDEFLEGLEDQELKSLYRKLKVKYGAEVNENEELSDKEIEDILFESLQEHQMVEQVTTFDEASIMTKNYGVIARIGGKDYQFQINGSWRSDR